MSILILDSILMSKVSALVEWERTIIVNERGKVKMIPDHHKLRAYTANELKLFAKAVGFEEVKIYGDFKRTDTEPRDARRLVLIAIK